MLYVQFCNMESNNIITAPAGSDVEALYKEWSRSHTGNRFDFFRMLTMPSAERDAFMSCVGVDCRYVGDVAVITAKQSVLCR